MSHRDLNASITIILHSSKIGKTIAVDMKNKIWSIILLTVCYQRLGLESGQIADEQIIGSRGCTSLSSFRLFRDPVFEIHYALYNSEASLPNWCIGNRSPTQSVTITLLEDYVITAMATQGGIIHSLINGSVYVSHYKPLYKKHKEYDKPWKTYLNLDGSDKVQLNWHSLYTSI